MLIEVGGFSTSAAQAGILIHKVEDDMRALGGTGAYAPGMKIGLTGDVAISAEEMAALVQDLKQREETVLHGVLQRARVRRQESDNFGWPEEIPALVR